MRFNFSLSFIECFFATIFSILFLLSIDTFAQNPYITGVTNNAYPKISETDLYDLFSYECKNETKTAGAILVLKVTPEYVLTQTVLEKIVEKEIIPIFEQKCGQLDSLDIGLYIKGVRIGSKNIRSGSQEYSYNQPFPSGVLEIPLTGIKVHINKQPPFPYLYERNSFFISSLADYRKINAKAETDRVNEKYSKNFTSDGKLNLTNISNENKKLFHQIYNGEFAELATPNKDEYIPYGLFPGLIANYSALCRSSLSPSAIKVDEYAERYLGTEYMGFSKTRYYEKYLAQTVFMEPKYERMYGASTGIALIKLFNFERKKNGTMAEKFASMLLTPVFDLVSLADDTQQVVSSNKCGSPSIIKFTENLHTFVSGSWKPKNVTDYEFTENDFTNYTVRNYKNTPPTFSPKFWIPTTKHLEVYLNAVEPLTDGGNVLGKKGLSLIEIHKLCESIVEKQTSKE